MDDLPNIVNNYPLHLDSIRLQTIVNTFFSDPHNPEQLRDRPYRPVACLTFALNWYFGQDRVFGYHLVNTAIHTINAFLIFIVIGIILNTPNMRETPPQHPLLVALLASALWAAHPIQTQAVTYIVQRMAQLAALFYLTGLYAYLKARLSHTSTIRMAWLVACVISLVLGIFSKPNAAMLPLAIVLVEVVFFQDLSDKKRRNAILIAASLTAVMVVLGGSVLFLKGDPLNFLNLYRSRTFSPIERLLTQPRVVLFYLSQLFFPLPHRFSIAHDIVVSSSLFSPWTTLPSMLGVISLIGFSIAQLGKRPLIAFAVLFFFLNHIVESSIIGLELIFEHRNYLPSFFIFLPVACGLGQLVRICRKQGAVPYGASIFLTLALVGALASGSYLRNRVWKDDITLWSDAVNKAPNDARATNILAMKLAWGEHSRHPRRYDMSLKLFNASLEKNLPRNDVKAGIYGNMALIYFHQKKDVQKAYHYFNEALKIDPGNLKIRREYAEAMILNRDFQAARAQVDILLSRNRGNGRYLNLKGLLLLWLGDYPGALTLFKEAYPLLAEKSAVLLNSAVALSLAGHHANAAKLLEEGISQFPADMTFYFAAIENGMLADNPDRAMAFAQKMLTIFTQKEIDQGVKIFSDNPMYAPLHAAPIRMVFERLHSLNVDGQ